MPIPRRDLLATPFGLGAVGQFGSGPTGGDFILRSEDGRLVSLRYRGDTFDTDYIDEDAALGHVRLAWRREGAAWTVTDTYALKPLVGDDPYTAVYALEDSRGLALRLEVRFSPAAHELGLSISVRNLTKDTIELGDLGLPLPMRTDFKAGIPATASVLKHSFISGDGSFLFWMRSNSAGPFLMMTPRAGTQLNYWQKHPQSGKRRGIFCAYVYSQQAGEAAAAKDGTWRLPHASQRLAPAGQTDDHVVHGFDLSWARDYQAVRDRLAQRSLDVQIVPGMTLPTDLTADMAIRSPHTVTAIEAEYPNDTDIIPAGKHGNIQLYRLAFRRLGENRLAVRQSGGRVTWLEFFVTEPVETLIRKRAAFVANHQVRDTSKWYNGLLCEWNMESQTLLTPDNYDRIKGWRIYAVTCDDPGLSKPAFLASKQADYPVQAEVTALDDYIEHFVWGGLQRTTEETYPYGIYGIPDWKQNRESKDPGIKGQMHIWRPYDYPHLVAMYYALYRTARDNPQIKTRLGAQEYLKRAGATAIAMFTIPIEVDKWSAYETGFYNELVIPELIDTLDETGRSDPAFADQAASLRRHWEQKVRYFVNDNKSLFVSEYAFDSTGFESTQALARYALDTPPEGVTRDAALRFSKVQLAANLFCRGVIEPSYYYLGSDYRGSAGDSFTLTYMSAMGGWSLLDYAMHDAKDPVPHLRTGFASCLSAWALVNSGTSQSNYGYWYPGKANDGAAGGGFEPASFGETWLEQPHHRGSWYYSCESDLGFCGYLRAAATAVSDDPLFGRIAYLGQLQEAGKTITVVPRDGVRRRFYAVLKSAKVSVSLERDRFAAEQAITLSETVDRIAFSLESDHHGAHEVTVKIEGSLPGRWRVEKGEGAVKPQQRSGRQTIVLKLPEGKGPHAFVLTRA